MTMITLNLKDGNFKTVQEGTRNLEITKVEVVPSGKPTQMKLYMKDVEDGASLINTYKFDNDTSVFVMGIMLSIALGLEDGDEFDTADADKLVGIVLNCDIAHSEYNGRTYANVKKVNSRVDNVSRKTTVTVNETTTTRAALYTNDLD